MNVIDGRLVDLQRAVDRLELLEQRGQAAETARDAAAARSAADSALAAARYMADIANNTNQDWWMGVIGVVRDPALAVAILFLTSGSTDRRVVLLGLVAAFVFDPPAAMVGILTLSCQWVSGLMPVWLTAFCCPPARPSRRPDVEEAGVAGEARAPRGSSSCSIL